MILVEDETGWYYVNPEYPDSPLSPKFDDSAYALQWRGRVGQENFLDVDELQKELDALSNGDRIVLPKSKEHAEAMIRVATFYLDSTKNDAS